MAPMDPNIFLGKIMNSPIFWVMASIIGFMLFANYMGWIGKGRKQELFKQEDLYESLMKDLRPRLKQGKKVRNTVLIQNMIKIGKVRKYSISKLEFHVRDKDKKGQTEEEKMKKVESNMIYLTVGGNPWISWIPIIGKDYEPEYYVMNSEYVEYDPQSKIFEIHKDVHMYPYARIWISDKKIQQYLTELEARRTQEFEAETNINTLKRWTYYQDRQAGRVVVMEKDAKLEEEKWDNTREVAD